MDMIPLPCNICRKNIDLERQIPEYFKGRICSDCWKEIAKEVKDKQENDKHS